MVMYGLSLSHWSAAKVSSLKIKLLVVRFHENLLLLLKRVLKKPLTSGVIGGYPVVDFKVTLYDGSYHDVDSSELAFKIAGSMAFKEAMNKASPSVA